MRSDRLTLALEAGLLPLPAEGRILVLRPRAGDDLSALPQGRVQVVTGFRPDADAFAALGYDVAPEPQGRFAAALVCAPRARDHAHALLAQAAAAVMPGGAVLVDGQKTDGIESLWRDLREVGANPTPALSKAHGRIFAFAAGAALPTAWAAQDRDIGGFVTRPGVFSADGPDAGSALLANALPARLPSRVADLGAGWGYLSRAILSREGVQECHLIEAEAEALACARLNIPDPRAQFHWADATRFRAPAPFGAVVCNPPFHTGRDADPTLGIAFLRAAAGMLTTSGTLWLVANRHLPYERVLAETFREVEDLPGTPVFRLYRASRPIPRRPT